MIQEASAEVRGAVVYASLIVIAVLTPIMVLGGIAGRIFSPLAETYGLAVGASLLVALTVTPALAALLLPRLGETDRRDTLFVRRLRGGYDRVLASVRRRPGRIAFGSAVLGLAALVALPFLGGGFLPEFREGVLIAEATAWPGTSLAQTTELSRRIDRVLRKKGGPTHIAAHAGRASLDEDAAPANRVEMDLRLPHTGDPEEIGSTIDARLSTIPGIRFGVEGILGERIDELLSGERAPIAVELRGNDLSALRTAASSLLHRLTRVEGVEAPRTSGLVDAPTIDLRLDDGRLAVAGVRRRDVIEAAATWREGLRVAEVQGPSGVPVPVVITAGPSAGARAELLDVPVFTSTGAVLPLSSLVRVEDGAEPPVITHAGGRRLITVAADAEPGELSAVAARIGRLVRSMRLPKGVSWDSFGSGRRAERGQHATRLRRVPRARSGLRLSVRRLPVGRRCRGGALRAAPRDGGRRRGGPAHARRAVHGGPGGLRDAGRHHQPQRHHARRP